MQNTANESNEKTNNDLIIPTNSTVTFVTNVHVTYKDAQVKPSGSIIMQPNTEISFHKYEFTFRNITTHDVKITAQDGTPFIHLLGATEGIETIEYSSDDTPIIGEENGY